MTGCATAPWGVTPARRLHSALERVGSIYALAETAAREASPAEATTFARIFEEATCALILMRSLLGELRSEP